MEGLEMRHGDSKDEEDISKDEKQRKNFVERDVEGKEIRGVFNASMNEVGVDGSDVAWQQRAVQIGGSKTFDGSVLDEQCIDILTIRESTMGSADRLELARMRTRPHTPWLLAWLRPPHFLRY